MLKQDGRYFELFGDNLEDARASMLQKGLQVPEKADSVGRLLNEAFEQVVEPKLVQPTFVMDYPIEISPLARKHRTKIGLVERFELFISGVEIANSFSELNDSFEQKERLLNQQSLIKKGDDEAQVLDEDFIKVLETGMPPTGGVGVGIDRVVMIFSEQKSIKDVIFFPSMRPE